MRTANRDLGAMASFNGAQRALCVREYYRNNDSATEARRKFCSHYNIRNVNQAPTIQTIQNWVRKFESTGSTLTQPGRGRPRTSRDPENIERVRESGPFFMKIREAVLLRSIQSDTLRCYRFFLHQHYRTFQASTIEPGFNKMGQHVTLLTTQ